MAIVVPVLVLLVLVELLQPTVELLLAYIAMKMFLLSLTLIISLGNCDGKKKSQPNKTEYGCLDEGSAI